MGRTIIVVKTSIIEAHTVPNINKYCSHPNTSAINKKTIGVGSHSYDSPKEVIIDGQQRLTSLYAVIKGKKVIDSNYEEKNIKTSEDRPVGMAIGIPTGDRNVDFYSISFGIVVNI